MVADEGDYSHPVPVVCPLPRNAVALIGGEYWDYRFPTYRLWKNGKELTIEAPEHKCADGLCQSYKEFRESGHLYKVLQEYGYWLEIIRMHLDEIHFEESNFAYILPDNKAGFYIYHRPKSLHKVSCPPWAPFINERDVHFTVWGSGADRRGIWQGKEVDVFYAWEDNSYSALDLTMYAAKVLVDMDLAFEVYGHLTNDQGKVIGLVSEAGKGRLLKLSDRAIIYATVARLQSLGYLYRGCWENRFLITPQGKVRLTEMLSLVLYSPDQHQMLEEHAEFCHWRALAQLFEEMKISSRRVWCGNHPPLVRYLAKPSAVELVIPPPPGLVGERVLTSFYFAALPNIFQDCCIPVWEGYRVRLVAYFTERSKRQRQRVSGTRRALDNRKRDSKYDEDDKPFLGTLSRAHQGAHSGITFHPYIPRSISLSKGSKGAVVYYPHNTITQSRSKTLESDSASSRKMHSLSGSSDRTITLDGSSDTFLNDSGSSTKLATGSPVDRRRSSTISPTTLDISSHSLLSHTDAVDEFFQMAQVVFEESQPSTSCIEEVED